MEDIGMKIEDLRVLAFSKLLRILMAILMEQFTR
jgi:hypothetical protein